MSVFTGWWAERAGRAEQDADRMAALLSVILERHGPSLPYPEWAGIQDCVRDWQSNRERRYGPLPAGHTNEGNLTSGGIHM